MRPINRGAAPGVYSQWGKAKYDLMDRLGPYCSYCEMPVTNLIAVEHIVPRSHGGEPLAWTNFLLSCTYCNSVKKNRNTSRIGYLWPDRDNTDLALQYDEERIIYPFEGMIEEEAQATINLMGLDRRTGGKPAATFADLRPLHRTRAWANATASLNLYEQAPSPIAALLISGIAAGFGFYSIWMTVFDAHSEVTAAIRNVFPGTYSEVNENGIRLEREGGLI